MKRPIKNILLFAILYMTAASASAALVNSQLIGVNILGTIYNVTFWADDGGFDNQSVADMAVLEPTLLDNANYIVTDIDNAWDVGDAIKLAGGTPYYPTNPGFAYNPGGGNTADSGNYSGFRLVTEISGGSYSYYTYNPNTGMAFGGIGDVAFTDLLTADDSLSLATFELAEVPLPAAVWLFGSALVGFSFFRKKAVRA